VPLGRCKTANRAQPARCETTTSGRLPGNKPHSRFQMQMSQSIDATGRKMRLGRSYKLVSLFSNRRECLSFGVCPTGLSPNTRTNWFFTGRRFPRTRRELPLGATAADASNRLPHRILSKLNQTAIGKHFQCGKVAVVERSEPAVLLTATCHSGGSLRSTPATLPTPNPLAFGILSARSL
jgi:hypothetical protein